MALQILPPEPLVQGRSMRTGTAEATAIFAIFLDRIGPHAHSACGIARLGNPEAAIHGRTFQLFLRSSIIAPRLRLCASPLRFLQARCPEAAIHGRTLDKSTFVGRLTAGFVGAR
jgi:hypothetical protein